MSYTYDDTGNLLTKLDARSITTCFGTLNGSTCTGSYDGANRPLAKSYTDGTPGITFTYGN